MFKKLILLIFLVWSFAQTSIALDDKLDSLWNTYHTTSDTDKKLETIESISNILLFRDLDSAFKAANEYWELSRKENSEYHQASSLNKVGRYYAWSAKFDSALIYFDKALFFSEKLEESYMLSSTYTNIGGVHYDQANYTLALENWQKAHEIHLKVNDIEGISNSHINLGVLYVAVSEYDKALYHYDKARELALNMNNKSHEAYILTNMGDIYLAKKSKFEALANKINARKLFEEVGNVQRVANTTHDIAKLYFEMGRDSLALLNMRQAYEAIKDFGNKLYISEIMVDLGNVYMKNEVYDSAFYYCENAYNVSKEIDAKSVKRDACLCLSSYYEYFDNIKKSLKFLKEYIEIKEQIAGKKTVQELTKSEMQFKFKKERELAKKEQEKQAIIARVEKERQQTLLYSVSIGLVGVFVFMLLFLQKFRVTKKQKRIIENQKLISEEQRDLVNQQNQDIISSIQYAKRIQDAILPSTAFIKKQFKESFILFKPRDVVSGDFYWMEEVDGSVFFAVADCTGHGVPGAMVSVVCSNALSKCVLEEGLKGPAEILNRTKEIVIKTFSGGNTQKDVRDGMDISFAALHFRTEPINPKERNESDNQSIHLQWSGANNPLWIIRNKSKEVEVVQPDKMPIGKFTENFSFSQHDIEFNLDDQMYLFSDGYADQFGGLHANDHYKPGGKKLKTSNFKKYLLEIKDQPMVQQEKLLDQFIENWKSGLEQLDDICVLGIKF